MDRRKTADRSIDASERWIDAARRGIHNSIIFAISVDFSARTAQTGRRLSTPPDSSAYRNVISPVSGSIASTMASECTS